LPRKRGLIRGEGERRGRPNKNKKKNGPREKGTSHKAFWEKKGLEKKRKKV